MRSLAGHALIMGALRITKYILLHHSERIHVFRRVLMVYSHQHVVVKVFMKARLDKEELVTSGAGGEGVVALCAVQHIGAVHLRHVGTVALVNQTLLGSSFQKDRANDCGA